MSKQRFKRLADLPKVTQLVAFGDWPKYRAMSCWKCHISRMLMFKPMWSVGCSALCRLRPPLPHKACPGAVPHMMPSDFQSLRCSSQPMGTDSPCSQIWGPDQVSVADGPSACSKAFTLPCEGRRMVRPPSWQTLGSVEARLAPNFT